jgi:hypothetical protein
VSPAGHGGALTELPGACLPALQVPDALAVALRPRPAPLWTATDALAQFSRLLATLPDGSPLAAFLPHIDRDAPSRALRSLGSGQHPDRGPGKRASRLAAAGTGGRLDAHPGQPPRGRRSCRRCFRAAFLIDGAGTIGSAANFDKAPGHAPGKARLHARGGNIPRYARKLRAPRSADIPGPGHLSSFEQIERRDHERESPAVDDWDAA